MSNANMTPQLGLSADDVEIGLKYCRWLGKKRFTHGLNKDRELYGLPAKVVPAFIHEERGKRIYNEVLRAVRQHGSGVMLHDRELGAVRDALIFRKYEIAPTATMRAEARLAEFQKFVSNGKRIVRGLASSISVDRVGDIVEPRGGSWRLPVPLLWQHSHKDPIGWVRSIEVRNQGLWIEAEIAEGFARADETWQMVQAGLMDAFSIGFRTINSERISGGGQRFTSWELLEVSVVTIPANPDARISRVGSPKAAEHPGSVKLLERR